jgi:hypothetical protein
MIQCSLVEVYRYFEGKDNVFLTPGTQNKLSKQQLNFCHLHSVPSLKVAIFIVPAMRSSKVTDEKIYTEDGCSRNNTSEINIKYSVSVFHRLTME